MKYVFSVLALCLFAGMAFAQDEVADSTATSSESNVIVRIQPFGYLSYNDVLKAMPEYADAMNSIEQLKVSYDEELSRAEKEFSKKFEEYLEGHKSFPENIMLKRQKELQLLMDQSIQFKAEAKELLAKAEADLMKPLYERLGAAIKAVGAENKYAYILNTDANAYPYICEDGEAEDCTDMVLNKLGVK